MSARAARLLREHFDEVVEIGAQRTRSEIPQYRDVPVEQPLANVAAGFDAVLADLEDPPYRHYRKIFSEISYRRAREGFEILNLNAVVALTEDILYQFIGIHIANADERISAIMACHGVCTSGRLGIMESFGRSNQEHLNEASRRTCSARWSTLFASAGSRSAPSCRCSVVSTKTTSTSQRRSTEPRRR